MSSLGLTIHVDLATSARIVSGVIWPVVESGCHYSPVPSLRSERCPGSVTVTLRQPALDSRTDRHWRMEQPILPLVSNDVKEWVSAAVSGPVTAVAWTGIAVVR